MSRGSYRSGLRPRPCLGVGMETSFLCHREVSGKSRHSRSCVQNPFTRKGKCSCDKLSPVPFPRRAVNARRPQGPYHSSDMADQRQLLSAFLPPGEKGAGEQTTFFDTTEPVPHLKL